MDVGYWMLALRLAVPPVCQRIQCVCLFFCWKDCFCVNDNFVSWQCPSAWRQMYFPMAARAWVWIPAVGAVGWVWPYHSWPRSPWIPRLITQQPITFSLNLFIVSYYTEGPALIKVMEILQSMPSSTVEVNVVTVLSSDLGHWTVTKSACSE